MEQRFCYLFLFGPTPEVLPTDHGYGIFEPVKGLFMAAVDDATFEHFVVINARGFNSVYLKRVVFQIAN